MNKINVYGLPIAFNVCGQLLREVDQSSTWSMAHVLMNPKAFSLLHEHHTMDEAYIITRGAGQLICGDSVFGVQSGDVIWIPRNTRHKLTNTGAASLEHLVLAAPPFDPHDVHVNQAWRDPGALLRPFEQPSVIDCFDGAKIIAYECKDIVSVAFGWVTADPARRKVTHYHKKITEWIYVVEGHGAVEIDGIPHAVSCGDWIRVDPGTKHALRNNDAQYMVVVCVCTPCFSMDDVYQ